MKINTFNITLLILAVNSYILYQNTTHVCTLKFRLDPSLRRRRRSSVFFINFEHIWYLFLVFLLLNLNR